MTRPLGTFLLIILLLSVNVRAQELDFDEDLFSDFGEEEQTPALSFKSFLEARCAPRLFRPTENPLNVMGEARLQLDARYTLNKTEAAVVTDLKYSALQLEPLADIENGVGMLDIRELSLRRSIGSSVEARIGRQILTWGTGDLLFINDLFPKDWESFFVGRQLSYLKAPSNAVKVSHYNRWFTLDLVWTPLFNPDRLVSGANLEYFDPLSGSTAGTSALILPQERNNYLEEDELAVRLHKVVNRVELDLYGYDGFWKTPEGFTDQNQYFFPKLTVAGTSLRTPLLTGIFNLEYGHYFSRDLSEYSPQPIRNSEDRLLLGFEKELARNFTAGTQLYLEYINDYERYRHNFRGFAFRDELKTMITLRLECTVLDQNLRFSLFNFYSPTENDLYSRNTITYKYYDNLQYQLGINYFSGADIHSFWGQFHTNSNVFWGIVWYL